MQAVKNQQLLMKNKTGTNFNYNNGLEQKSLINKFKKMLKSLFTNNNKNEEVSTMESKEIKNFTKKIHTRREETNIRARYYSFNR